MDDGNKEYRAQLLAKMTRSQESYDKSLLSLSGGALAISFAFVDRFLTNGPIVWVFSLVLAWCFWVFCMTAVLFSFQFSRCAFSKVIDQLDGAVKQGKNIEVCLEDPGGKYARYTTLCNWLGGPFFILGLISIFVFAWMNIGAV